MLEPTAEGPGGHYLPFIASAGKYLAEHGFRAVLHVAGKADLRAFERKTGSAELRNTFTYREAQDFSDMHAGQVTPADPWARRFIRQQLLWRVNRLPAWFGGRDPTTVENIAFRLNAILAGLGSRFGVTVVERRALSRAVADLARLLETIEKEDGLHHVFFAGQTWLQLMGMVDLIEGGRCDFLKSVHVRVFSFRCDEIRGAHLLPLIERVHRAAAGRRLKLFWYCETPWAQSCLSDRLRVSVGYMDYNAFRLELADCEDTESAAAEASEPAVFFPGTYRRFADKGMGFMTDLAEAASVRGELRLRLQALPETDATARWRTRLMASGVVDFGGRVATEPRVRFRRQNGPSGGSTHLGQSLKRDHTKQG